MTKTSHAAALLLLAALLLFASAGPARAASGDYILGPGDVIRINVYDHPDLVTEARISESGTISFPLLGEIKIGGDTTNKAEARIAAALSRRGLVKEPQINITVEQYKSQQISVLGQVNRPGRYPIEGPATVTDLLAMAQGINAAGSDTVILVHRGGGKTARRPVDTVALFEGHGDGKDPTVGNGDIIYVPRAPKFYIYGEVQRPGQFRLEENMTVVQALSVGGGPTLRGSVSGLRIERRGPDGKVETKHPKLTDPVLPDDVIYVKESLF